MSSTTDRRGAERGQVLVLYAGAFVTICLIAALVFDVGQNLLDRRAEQNAADASALAGARYVLGAGYSFHGGCRSGSTLPAVRAACDVAAANGYVDGQDDRTVRVDFPPVAPSTKAGLPGHIQVSIGSTRPSLFMGIIGIVEQRTGAMGVATNASDIALPYSLLALNPSECGANKITGSPGTIVQTNGTVHVDSSCATSPGALQLSGNGVLTAPECDVVGTIVAANNAHNNCASAPTGVLVFGDPLRNLPAPSQPGAPLAVQPLDVMPGPIPAACPGGASPATDATPAVCSFANGAMAGKTYRIFPGNYPGGIATSKATLLMSPGIYWIGGSGIQIQTAGAMISKALGDDAGSSPSGGVLIYNTSDPVPASGCTGAGCYGPITINGGGGGTPTLALLPIEAGLYRNMVIFVDRAAAAATGFDLDLNGESSVLSVTGTIYAPSASFRFNGSESDVLSAQVICDDFVVNGSGAAFTINYDEDLLFHVKGVGLVE